MKYGLTLVFLAAALAALFVRGLLEEKKKKAAFARRLLESYGEKPFGYEKKQDRSSAEGKKPEPSAKRTGAGGSMQERFEVDEITWKELDMDAVFDRVNYTLSRAGEDYLYDALHRPAQNGKEARRWEKGAAYFASHGQERVRIQMVLAQIGKEKGLPFSRALASMREEKGRSALAEYAADALYVAAVFLGAWDAAAGILLFAATAVFQIVAYFRRRAEILPHLRSVAELLRVADSMERLRRTLPADIQKETEREFGISLSDCIRRLKPLRRHSFWVMQCGSSGSDPLSLLCDYARMLFHPDLIQFMTLKNKILSLEPVLSAAYGSVGYVDSTVSITMYRASLKVWCVPALYDGTDMEDGGHTDPERGGGNVLRMEDGRHPLLEGAVPNSIRVGESRGVLVTGSNASGKSTFLKMTALNLLLAQTIHTAPAKSFSAPFCRVYTAMRADDDLRRGESSYMAEILSLKRILDAGKRRDEPAVFCFVDEILRGTNTVERIAASGHILKSMRPPFVFCFAATHDRELTELLKQEYDNYYFPEELKDGRFSFPYRLTPGKAQTGNAIRLLALVGYDDEIIEGASAQAQDFMKEGVWR